MKIEINDDGVATVDLVETHEGMSCEELLVAKKALTSMSSLLNGANSALIGALRRCDDLLKLKK